MPVDIAVKAAGMINDGVAEFVAGKPDRFAALGTVPMPDAAAAASELERCMKTLGFKGVQILTNVAGKELSDPAFAPFWAKAEALGAVVLIHPNGFTEAQRLSRFYFNNIVGNPLETTIALHYLIFDGVLERHPNLKIIAVHGGGFLGGYSGRIDHAWGARSDAHGAPAQAAVELSQEDLRRHGRIHTGPARRAGRNLRRRSRADGHRLPLRHGGIRPARASRRDEEPRRDRGRRDRRRQCAKALGDVGGLADRGFRATARLALRDCGKGDLADACRLSHPAALFSGISEPGINAMKRRDVLAGFAALSGCALAPRLGVAQAKYPDRAIKLVVPFAPGGVNDQVARLWAERMKALLGTVYIENQGGAGGAVGALGGRPRPPDGYTLLLGGAGALVLNPIGMVKPLYDPIKDFEPIAMTRGAGAHHRGEPQRSRAYAQGVDRLRQGQSGQARLWLGRRGIDDASRRRAVQVAGAKTPGHHSRALQGLRTVARRRGQRPRADVVANITSQVLELHRTGKLRMIVVTAPDRLVAAPDIPTAVESGLPGMIAVNFTGLFAPRGTPKPIVEQIAAATDKVMEDDDFRAMLIDAGLEPYRHSTPEKTAQFVEQDIARWTPVFRSIGLKLN